jgi:general secretion pathway protein G
MRRNGFTLIELMVVLTIIGLLLAIVVPDYMGRAKRAEEAALQQDLAVMRDALDKHFADAGKYPSTLDELVSKRYLRSIPKDPVAPSATWVVVPPADPQKGGVYDVRSGAKGVGSNGMPYDHW